jgi:hypothetical protein
MAIRNVLKSFRFSRPHAAGAVRNGVPPELVFHPGVQEIDDDVLAHPCVAAGADGCIESEEEAEIRATNLAEAAKLSQQLANEANVRARAAFNNLVAAHNRTSPNAPLDERSLDLPLSVLQARQDRPLTSEEEQGLVARAQEERHQAMVATNASQAAMHQSEDASKLKRKKA